MTNNTSEKIKVTPLDDRPDWTFDLLDKYQKEIARVADFYRLDTYTNQIEVITAEQMMDAYASVGMPIGYNHWTFGKKIYSDRTKLQAWTNGSSL
jgi:spore cortex formation protein SpoVR/YcgB (stage V sporulation)